MANKTQLRGVDRTTEFDIGKLRRDVRRPEQKFWDAMSQTKFGYYFLTALLVTAFIVPGILFVIFALCIFWVPMLYGEVSRRQLPLRLPIEAEMTDFGDPTPGHRGFNKARGWFYVGRDAKTSEELYLTGEDLLAHTLVFGTTGAGKTEFLTGWGANSLSIGSGLVYIDAKGTSALHAQIYMLSRMFGRDDDYLVLNFATGGKQVSKNSPIRKSNTLNPLSTGTPEALFSLLSAFLPASNGENAIFAQKAGIMMSSILYPLVWLRNKRALRLSVRAVREHISLEKVMMLAGYPEGKPVYGEMIPEDISGPAKFYLSSSVAGFNPKKAAHEQEADTMRYHDFSQNYFSMPLSFMSDTYGFVYDCEEGEVDFEDVIYRRRVLTVLLPSVEKSPTELQQLGGLILTGIKNVLSLGIGDKYEGESHDMLLKLPVRTDKPTLCIVDEIGYIIVEGFAVTAAQARGLGTAFVYAGQDYAGLKRGSEIEAEQITANTRSKFVMSLEDVQQTWTIVKELAGEGYAPTLTGYQLPEEQSTKTYRANKTVDMERRSRVDVLDLKGQIEGDFHMFFRERLVRGQAFHAALEPKKKNVKIQINRFLEILPPSPEALDEKYGFIFDAKQVFVSVKEIDIPEHKNPIMEALAAIDVDQNISSSQLACIIMQKDQSEALSKPVSRMAPAPAEDGDWRPGMGSDRMRMRRGGELPTDAEYPEDDAPMRPGMGERPPHGDRPMSRPMQRPTPPAPPRDEDEGPDAPDDIPESAMEQPEASLAGPGQAMEQPIPARPTPAQEERAELAAGAAQGMSSAIKAKLENNEPVVDKSSVQASLSRLLATSKKNQPPVTPPAGSGTTE
jgi:intracellular multiplication protein IcmO